MNEHCDAITEDGLHCQKKNYQLPNGEYIDHAGGHIYASPILLDKLSTHHYDASKLLAGELFEMHHPDDCPQNDTCWNHRLKLTGATDG